MGNPARGVRPRFLVSSLDYTLFVAVAHRRPSSELCFLQAVAEAKALFQLTADRSSDLQWSFVVNDLHCIALPAHVRSRSSRHRSAETRMSPESAMMLS
jgi:hypothetical protein